MSTGVPIYLVSACTTGEEFVAAFRRYADRSGLFIPIADPIPVGKRGRFAVTLRDGGVMVEGVAEVMSSTRTPSVLHGRIGMTVRFVEADEASKTVLVELEKARLSMKPPPPSVPPRPADVPPAPRPVPPPPAGRIDASNALAECVAIGDVETLEAAPSAPKPTGPKFVVPSVAPVPEAQRSRSPSGPHSLGMRPRSPSTPPATGPARAPSPSTPGALRPHSPSTPPIGVPGALRPHSPSTPPMGMPVPPRTPSGGPGMPPVRAKTPSVSSTQPAAVVPPPAAPAPPPMPAPAPLPPGMAAAHRSGQIPLPGVDEGSGPRASKPSRSQTMALPAMLRLPADSKDTMPLQAVPDDEIAIIESSPIAADPAPPAAPIVPPGAAAKFADGIPAIELDEPTDLTEMPSDVAARPTPAPFEAIAPERTDKAERAPRRTVLGIAVVPEGMTVLPASASGQIAAVHDTTVMTAQQPTVEEPTPSGNWTITPGADKPTLEPRAPAGKAPPGPPTGDWSISIQPDSPDGWSEPSKVEKRASTQPGPPVSAVASTRALDSAPKSEPIDAVAEPKVEIDPTLMEPLTAMPRAEDSGPMPPPGPVSMPMPAPAYPASPPFVGFTPPVPRAATGADVFGSSSVTGEAAYPSDAPASKRTRTIVIIGSALLAVAIGIFALAMMGGDDAAPKGATPPAAADAAVSLTSTIDAAAGEAARPDAAEVIAAAPPVDAGAAVAAVVDAPPEAAPVDAAPALPADGMCKVDVASTPAGAEIVIGKTVAGTTPAALKLPCGTEAKLLLRKARFVSATRALTPGAKPAKVRVKLDHVMFLVKVSSSPPGATVFVGGKSIGVTPSTARLPAFETSTLTFSKPGYASETQKVTPKQNNQTIHSPLRKAAKKSK